MINNLSQIGDADVFDSISVEDLWCVDKLILAKKLGYVCGPAGIAPPYPGQYVVRPIMNLKMMSRGASIQYLDSDSIPDLPGAILVLTIFRVYRRLLSRDSGTILYD